MPTKFKCVRGTKDILPDEVGAYGRIEDISKKIFTAYGYRQIRTPIIETRDLFMRSLGKDSEVVGKQMFTIERGDDVFVLRPEATAGVMRAYLENNLDKKEGFVKLYYIGPMFRAERPQKGRLRQFHHIGVEAIGSNEASLDIEVISLACSMLAGFGIIGFVVKINSLGCRDDKNKFAALLRSALQDKHDKLCADCAERLKHNVFRILDCKNDECRKIVSGIGIARSQYLCADCMSHFDFVLEGLDALGIKYQDTITLVRGLDYYTKTVFEIMHPDLGSQDAIGAGGRYDNLAAEIGESPVGAIGFAFGMERIILVAPEEKTGDNAGLVYIISLGQAAEKKSLKLLADLRKEDIGCDTDYSRRSLKGALRAAADLGASYVVIIGDNELNKGIATLKDMESGEQREIKQGHLIEELKYITARVRKPVW
ncbi:MAG: histidine--tRNA ligase [Candidatus Omnitrophica bacterium CG11_big_fil_rev_8_21_14_0_20_42_13]|uniref:Histidine--tRNA ligase n=1 Tax=Candidatus Ghiorseimicrobium undicola TaxID=1974746 RepID=A0A2H0LWH6_9BACT|nr:MAG: histidine--tRNA ligase [Candidatus Omnitrophica bacterium CG11_big_fil_rev_8_21_14_0_20_42_13]